MAIRAVLFDVGGPIDTEVEYDRLIDEHIRDALAARGIAVSDAEYAAANAWAIGAFAPNAYQAIIWHLAGHDIAVTERAYDTVAARGPERDAARGGIELRPGIEALLRDLHARGLRLGLAANQPASRVRLLDRLEIGELFTHREVEGVHGYRKPDPRLFLRCLDDLEVAPEEAVMVGDRIDNDIAPAKALGMSAIRLRTGRHAAQEPRSPNEIPDTEVDSVEGLAAALDALIDSRPTSPPGACRYS